jgi:hypothetical protein
MLVTACHDHPRAPYASVIYVALADAMDEKKKGVRLKLKSPVL